MIAVDHLTKRYGTVAAVDGLGFEVRQPNGLAIARRAVVLAGRCGTGDDRYSRRGGSRAFGAGQRNGLPLARRAVVLAGRCGTGDDRYSRRVGPRGAVGRAGRARTLGR